MTGRSIGPRTTSRGTEKLQEELKQGNGELVGATCVEGKIT
jgi:hypothetical protein